MSLELTILLAVICSVCLLSVVTKHVLLPIARDVCHERVNAALRMVARLLPENEWWLHGATLQGLLLHGNVGHYGGVLQIGVETLPDKPPSGVLVRADGTWRAAAMHADTGVVVEMYTRKMLGLSRSRVYPLGTHDAGYPIPCDMYPNYVPKQNAIADAYRAYGRNGS